MEIRLHAWNFNVGFQHELFLNSESKLCSCSGKKNVCTILKEEKKKMLFIRLLLFSCQVLAHSCEPRDCSLPGSSVHEILQARILEWVAISFSGKSSQPRRSNIGRHILYHCITREVLFIRKEIKICKIKILGSINDIYFS